MKVNKMLSCVLLFLSIVTFTQSSQSNELRVVCYYTNWSIYRTGIGKFSSFNIDPHLCTHVNYAFGGFSKENFLTPSNLTQDIENDGYKQFTCAKSCNENLKTLLSLGGWNEASSRYSAMVSSVQQRREFIKNSISFLRQHNFDGLDLDWQHPADRGGKPEDKNNYVQLVQELHEEFDDESKMTGRPRLLLTMVIPTNKQFIQKGYDIKKLNRYVDWFNLLTYDYHNGFEPSVNHHAPLYALEKETENRELNADYSVKYYINEGADPKKLNLGIPTYGRSFTLLDSEVNDIGSPADGAGIQGEITHEAGALAYYEICLAIKNEKGWTVVQPNATASGPFAFKGNQWVCYDDEASARKKGEYVISNGLGGIMFWSLDQDDFHGMCHGRPFPIIQAAKAAILGLTNTNYHLIHFE